MFVCIIHPPSGNSIIPNILNEICAIFNKPMTKVQETQPKKRQKREDKYLLRTILNQ